MSKNADTVKTFFKKYGYTLWLLAYAAVAGIYFLAGHIIKDHHIVYSVIDDAIPFVPAFAVPYFIWYLYVPIPMVILCFTDKYAFIRQAVTLLAGGLFCCAVFFIYPTAIDFRPEVTGDGVFERLCAWLFSIDGPNNVFPSLHCYEAAVIHLTTFAAPAAKKHKVLRALSAVTAALICASTVFIKQHSVLDVVAGCALAALSFIAFRRLYSKKEQTS